MGALRELVVSVLAGLDVFVLSYFLVLNSSYLVLIGLAALESTQHMRRLWHSGYEDMYASPFTLPVSIIAPAYNEEATIVESTRAMLGLRYPEFEVVVVDDGSTDGMFDALADAFGLVELPRVLPRDVPTVVQPDSLHVPADGQPLVVVRKPNSGRSDAINVGLNVARYPLVCTIDGDSILDPEALLTVSKPFADDPDRVVAAGGVIRAANGCRISGGRVVDVRLPRGWLPRIQVVEYLRAFLMGRAGWSRLGALTVISGAFSLFRRDVLVAVGGLDHTCIGEDFEVVLRIHRRMRDLKRDYRIVFVNEPVAWTEVPSTRSVLARQRRRWHRGLIEVLWRHRSMVGNPRYGRIGLVALPYAVAFELLAPVVELLGPFAVALGFLVGAVDVQFGLLFLLVAVGYGLVLSLGAFAVEEFSFHKYHRWRDVGTLVVAAFVENVGFRQMHALWRLQGLRAWVRGDKQVWGEMTRTGFDTGADSVASRARG